MGGGLWKLCQLQETLSYIRDDVWGYLHAYLQYWDRQNVKCQMSNVKITNCENLEIFGVVDDEIE